MHDEKKPGWYGTIHFEPKGGGERGGPESIGMHGIKEEGCRGKSLSIA
jgi:hypothetical protein